MIELIKNKLKFYLKKKKLDSAERIFFEKEFIPSLSKYNLDKVLFVGIAPYTYHYSDLFLSNGMTFYSVDNRNESNVWAKDQSKHQILDIRIDIKSHFNFKFDLIVFMGMIGYGVNDETDLKSSAINMSSLIKNNGHLLIAYESKFGINVEETIEEITCLESKEAFGYNKKIKLKDDQYRFYFYKKNS